MAFAFLVSGPLALMSVGPVVAVGTCALSAPSTVHVGDSLAIVGSGFPATTAAEVTFKVEGGTSDAFTVQSNATGDFQISLMPEEADAGKTTVTASAGSACSATVTFTVLGTNGSGAVPAATAAAAGSSTGAADGSASTSTGSATGSSTGSATGSGTGSATGSGTGSAPGPRTDALSVPAGSPAAGFGFSWLLAMVSLAIGLSGLLMTRPRPNR